MDKLKQRREEYKEKVNKMSNKQLLIELGIAQSVQTFPIDNFFGYDMEKIVKEEILKRMNRGNPYSNYINRHFDNDVGEHIYRSDGYSRDKE